MQWEGTRSPDPSSPRFGGQDLMALVRRMYEDSIIPVRDIARRAGVTERTLYKYARKGNWRPRYAWTPSGARPHGKAARQRWTEARERAAAFAPEKGAGGRFIRREDRDAPFAQGIKALDPAARATAVQAAAEAQRAARRAQADAEAQFQEHLRIIECVAGAVEDYDRFERERAKRPPHPWDDRVAHVHLSRIEAAERCWDGFMKDEDMRIAAVERPRRRGRHATASVTPPSAAAS